jgi:carboxymethylenebutenolidase
VPDDVRDIHITAPNGPLEAMVSVPDGSGPWPGVVVVHDAVGYRPDNRTTTARICAKGYVTITPNLFSRGRVRCITSAFRSLFTRTGPTVDDILAAREHLLAMPECSGPVGIVGFCMGGQFALLLSPRGFAATAPFYGTPLPRGLDDALDAACPVVASFGRRDPLGIGAGKRLNKVVEARNITADVKVYPDAGHSFANQLPAQPLLRITGFGYDEAATEDAWSRVFTFFDTHLRAG